MKWKISAFIIILLSANFCPLNTFASQNVLYVGGKGEGNYTSIQAAINAAEDSYIIYVYPGYYNESIVINKSISLIGIIKSGEKPVIDASGKAINITADNCTVKFFKILNSEIIISSDGNTIENNSLLYASIVLRNSSNNIISRNEIEASSQGIALYYSYDNNISKNHIKGSDEEGIFLWHSCNNVITMNEITQNDFGILVFSYSNNNTISYNNVFSNNFFGISIQGGSYNKVVSNHVYRNILWCGISIVKSWSVGNLILQNVIHDNPYGIHVEGVENIISRNNISNNEYGVYLSGWLSECRKNRIIENNLIENGINAGFDVHIFSFNIWYGNYWDDWKTALPKPIFGIVSIPITPLFSIVLPWINFDLQPATQPSTK